MITILGYGDKLSVRPGEEIDFKLSVEDTETVFHADVVRLRCSDDSPEGPGFQEAPVPSAVDGEYPARRQVSFAGSHVLVPSAPILDRLEAITLEVWVWPTTPSTEEIRVSSRAAHRIVGWDWSSMPTGCAALRVERFELSSGTPLMARAWTRIAGAYDPASGRACLVQRPRDEAPIAHEPAVAEAAVPEVADTARLPVVMAAWHGAFSRTGHIPQGLYNGKLAQPSIWSRAFDPETVACRRPAGARARRALGLLARHGIDDGDGFRPACTCTARSRICPTAR